MASEEADKTEAATPKRREDSRKKGQVAQSRELPSVALLVAATIIFGSSLAVNLVGRVSQLAATIWSTEPPHSLADFHAILLHAMTIVGLPVIAIIVPLTLAGSLAAVIQTGPMLSFEALAPKAERLSLLKGFKRMADPDRLFDLGKGLFKVAVVGTITVTVIRQSIERVVGLSSGSIAGSLRQAGDMSRSVALGSLAFLAVMAAIDVLYQRWRFETRLKMTKKEVRDEVKDRDGNPHVRGRARSMQKEMTRSRVLASVADASVVITNPTHFAVALQYTGAGGAPRVLAKGRNHVAARIREVARKNGVPIVENRPLARLLHRTAKVGEQIPDALYQAVAEVLAYVYRLNPERGRAWSQAR